MTLKTHFIYDRPVRGDEFVNREREVRGIFNDLYLGVSTVISGEPRIGKTSLLLQVANETIQRDYLGDDVNQFVFIFINLNSVDREDYTPSMFWQEVLSKLGTSGGNIGDLVEEAATTTYSRRSLNRLFEYLGQQGRRLVLLLDEFEWLLIHPNFQDAMFFGCLRSLAAYTGGLVIVLASRLSVTEMNRIGSRLLGINSALFGYVSERYLGPFDEEAVGLLLERISPSSRQFIRRVAGRHPFLLQAMSAILLSTTGNDHLRASERFYKQFAFHFKSLWYSLDQRMRLAALALSLLELSRWTNSKLNVEELLRGAIFGWQLDELAARGLAEQVGTGGNSRDVWHPKQWRVGTQAFAWWVRDVLIPASRQEAPLTIDEPYQYRLLLTQAESDWLASIVPNTPEWTGRGAESRALFEALLGGTAKQDEDRFVVTTSGSASNSFSRYYLVPHERIPS